MFRIPATPMMFTCIRAAGLHPLFETQARGAEHGRVRRPWPAHQYDNSAAAPVMLLHDGRHPGGRWASAASAHAPMFPCAPSASRARRHHGPTWRWHGPSVALGPAGAGRAWESGRMRRRRARPPASWMPSVMQKHHGSSCRIIIDGVRATAGGSAQHCACKLPPAHASRPCLAEVALAVESACSTNARMAAAWLTSAAGPPRRRWATASPRSPGTSTRPLAARWPPARTAPRCALAPCHRRRGCRSPSLTIF